MTRYELNHLAEGDAVIDSFTKVTAEYMGSYYSSTRMHTIKNEEYTLELPEEDMMNEYDVKGKEKTFADKIYEDMSLGANLGIEDNEDLMKLTKKELVGLLLHAKADLKYAKVDIETAYKELDKVHMKWLDLDERKRDLMKEIKSNKEMYEEQIKELEARLKSSTIRTITITK